MNPRIIIYAIIGGLLTLYGLWLIFEGDYFWGGLILAFGLMNGFQMIRSIKLEEDRKKLI
jgi:hypothetical protein